MIKKLMIGKWFMIAFVLANGLYAHENLFIKTYLFRGIQPGPRREIDAGKFPAVEFKNPQDSDAPVRLADILMNSLEFKAVDILYSFTRGLSNSGRSIREPFVVKPGWAFNLEIVPGQMTSNTASLHARLHYEDPGIGSKGGIRDEERNIDSAFQILESPFKRRTMPQILDREIVLHIDDPALCVVPFREDSDLLLVFVLKSNQNLSGGDSSRGGKDRETIGVQTMNKVLPNYPFDLREKGIEGTVKLQAWVDSAGIVKGIGIVKSLHPFLDHSSVMAIKQWTFSPARLNGEAVDGQIEIEFRFDRQAWLRLELEGDSNNRMTVTGGVSGKDDRLIQILDRGGKYSRMMATAALDFVCKETIRETVYPTWIDQIAPVGKSSQTVQDMGIRNTQDGPVRVIQGSSRSGARATMRVERKKYLSDFQLIKNGNAVTARRLPIIDQDQTRDKSRLPDDARYAALKPLFVMESLLSQDRQHLFSCLIRGEEKLHGRQTLIVEALPKSGIEGGVEYAKIWMEKRTGRIVQAEIEGIIMEGFEAILDEATRFAIRPEFHILYAYQVEHAGLLFPGKIEVRVYYPPLQSMARKSLKLAFGMEYDQYKFFRVETTSEIKDQNCLISGIRWRRRPFDEIH